MVPSREYLWKQRLPFLCFSEWITRVLDYRCPLHPLKAMSSHQKAWSWKGHFNTLLLFSSPHIFQGPWQENIGCLLFSLSQILCKYSNRFNYHKQDCYFSRPTDSSKDAFQDLDPKDSKKIPATVNCVRTIIRAQKEPLRLWGVMFQVEKHPKTSRSQEIMKCVSVLHQCLSHQAPLAFQEAVTKAAWWRLISEQGSSPSVFIAIRNYKM